MIQINYSKIKEKWKDYKKAHKKSQADISKICGWSKNTFGMMLTQKMPLSEKNLIKICNVLKINPIDIATGWQGNYVNLTYLHSASGQVADERYRTSEQGAYTLIYGDCSLSYTWQGKNYKTPTGIEIICQDIEHIDPDGLVILQTEVGKKFKIVGGKESLDFEAVNKYRLTGFSFPRI